MNILARVKKEQWKDTYKKGLPQYLCFSGTISLLFSWQTCIILPQKTFFLFFFYNLTCSGSSIVVGLFSEKIIDNHSSINMEFLDNAKLDMVPGDFFICGGSFRVVFGA